MEFKKKQSVSTDDFYYDLFIGGYIQPEKMLKHSKDVKKVRAAIDLIKKFKDEADKNEAITEI